MSEVAAVAPAPAAPAAPPPAAPAAPAEGVPQAAQNTAEQAPATEPEGEKPATTDEDPEKRGKSRYERRLDRAYKRAAEAQARAEFYERQLAESKAAAQPQADPAAPKLEQFSDIEKYAEAKAKYEADKTLKEHQSKQRAEQEKQQQALLVQDWETKAERGSDKYDDWQEVVGELKPTTPWAVGIMQVENGEDVAHFLGKNEKEAKRIIGLPPYAQLLEIGRLSAKLAAEPPKPKTPSKAPAPVAPLTGASPAVAQSLSDQKMEMKQWIALRNKQLGRVSK